MGFNLTNEKIKDTYEQLVQVSGSALVDGEGNDISVLVTSASHAVTASYAENASSEWNEITNKPSGLVSSSAQTIANLPSGTVSGSSQVDYNSISNVPSGILSSSAQIADDISGSFTSTSASIATDIAGNVSSISTNASNISTNTTDISTLTGETSSYAVKTSDNTFTGTQTFNDIAVNGTASISVLQSITGSAKIVGDAFIQLNTDTPALRYAGLQVVDSGSTFSTSSIIWDSETNDWFYEYEGDATDHGVFLIGPEYGTKGSPTYLTNNTIPKGDGGHHLNDSNIVDDGTNVTISTPLSASAVKLTSGGLTFADGTTQSTLAQGGLVSGTGTDSMKSADSLTANPATASGNNTIALGAGASATATNQIDIGGKFKYDGTDTIQLDSTNLLFNSSGTVTGNAINFGVEGGSVSGDYSSVFGGTYATISTGDATIFGGYNNQISAGAHNGVFSGEANRITGGDYSQIFGGASNTISAGDTSFIVGGYQNQVTAGVRNGVVGGNAAVSAHDFSVVIGRQSFTSTAAYTTYVANLETSGSITLGSEDIVNVSSGSATGSLIDNIHPAIASGSTAIQHIVTIDQTAYTTISGSGNVSDDTLYIISDATSTGVYDGDIRFTGFVSASGNIVADSNVEVGGQLYSPMFAGTIASSTSSIDFDNGNFATLNCSSATFLANPTNLRGGTTYTLVVTNGANISGYGTAWKFAGGTEPTLSANTDVITAVCDGTSLYAAALADFS